jgi:hypothetical protein
MIRTIVFLILFIAAAVVVDQYVLGCSEPMKVVGTVPYKNPNDEILSWSGPLGDLLCQKYGRCGVRIIVNEGPVPDDAVAISWRKGNIQFDWPCDPAAEVRCWTVWVNGWPEPRCTFGACVSNPVGQ